MIKINLLPFRTARKKENVRRQLSILFFSLFLVFILLVYYNIKLSGQVKEIKSKVETTKIETAKYEKINNEIAEIKGKLEILKTKMNVINTLESNRYEPVRLMDTMTSLVIPKRMWFVSLDARGNTVNISGVAVDNQTVADFMTRLERSNLFETVNLKTLKQYIVNKAIFKSFELSCAKRVKKEVKKEEKKAATSKAKK
ncbi:MAG: Pilus assembly protein PilN [Thermodesulfobacteriota bacterium]|nr:Pilus assembly protein PilN [Thermodesulfobacteriota bacterium]